MLAMTVAVIERGQVKVEPRQDTTRQGKTKAWHTQHVQGVGGRVSKSGERVSKCGGRVHKSKESGSNSISLALLTRKCALPPPPCLTPTFLIHLINSLAELARGQGREGGVEHGLLLIIE